MTFYNPTSGMAPNWVKLAPNETIRGLLKISYSTFWLTKTKYTQTDLKKSQMCTNLGQSDPANPQIPTLHDLTLPQFVSPVCFFSIVSSGFFTILYSMQWGKEKANEWLTTFVLSFFQSVVIVQPIKVR